MISAGSSLPGAVGPESPEAHGRAPGQLAAEQRGDQEAGEDEEDVHAEEAASHPRDAGVVQEDGDDSEGADAVEGREPAEALRPPTPGRRSASPGAGGPASGSRFSRSSPTRRPRSSCRRAHRPGPRRGQHAGRRLFDGGDWFRPRGRARRPPAVPTTAATGGRLVDRRPHPGVGLAHGQAAGGRRHEDDGVCDGMEPLVARAARPGRGRRRW